MKKIILAFLLILFSVFSFQKSFAQDIVLSPTPTPAIVNIQYDLPYPGLSPDNPLYFLKAIRDNLLGLFISDPVKKADYDLLMADKRLVSSQTLINENKDDLAITTLSKSGNYFYQAIQSAQSAKKQGENADPTIDRLLIASEKHQQVILEMEQKTSGETKENLDLLLGRVKGFEQSVQDLKSN